MFCIELNYIGKYMFIDGTIGSVFLMVVVGEIGIWGDVGVGGLVVVGVRGLVLLIVLGIDVIAIVVFVFFFFAYDFSGTVR